MAKSKNGTKILRFGSKRIKILECLVKFMRTVNKVISAFFLTFIMLLITPNASADNTESSASTLYTGTTYSYVCWDDACSYGVDRYDYYKFYLYSDSEFHKFSVR